MTDLKNTSKKEKILSIIIISSALLFFSIMYYNSRPIDSSIKAVKARAEKGNTEAEYQMAKWYLQGNGDDGNTKIEKDVTLGFKYYEMAAEKSDGHIQYELAEIYRNGTYTEANEEKAIHWHQKAAKNGSTGAQLFLGEYYLNKEEYNKAFKYLSEASDDETLGSIASFDLALLYMSGLGIEQNYVQAYKWLIIAAAGVPKSGIPSMRDKLASEMTAEQISEGQRLAQEWKETHSNLSDLTIGVNN